MPSSVDREIAELSELAASTVSLVEFRGAALDGLQRLIEFDFGVVWRAEANDWTTPTIRGFPLSFFEQCRLERARFEPELAPMMVAAVESGGAVIDRDVYSLRDRSRMSFYSEIIRPIGSRTYLNGVMAIRGAPIGVVQLGRATGAGSLFTEQATATLRRVLPVLSLGEAVRKGGHAPRTIADRALTRREHEIVEYLMLGFTNEQIGIALGTSFHTVKNQVATLFRKLGVASRSELLGLIVRKMPPPFGP
jgi:DNA-binding CsgD family transcriptional regulator